jgi:hypothetical protein
MPQGVYVRQQGWSRLELTYLAENFLKENNTELMASLTREFGTLRTIGAIARMLSMRGLVRGMTKEQRLARRAAALEEVGDRPVVTAHRDPRIASIMHLVDLKRAGFRQGHGEISNPGDGGLWRPSRENEPSSYLSSPAYACAY